MKRRVLLPSPSVGEARYNAHVSLSLSGTCWLFSASAGLPGLGVFLAAYAFALGISYHLRINGAQTLPQGDPAVGEVQRARWPLGVAGLGFGLAHLTGNIGLLAPLAVFVYCAFGCALADVQADAWSHVRARKSAGGER
ncbi:hypothetical protein [Caenispirillum bisanense]|uniref:hypothetical protein n=1 Tax=Caenispirillum bisanense TaxID=414052 RepID=UPI0031D7400A